MSRRRERGENKNFKERRITRSEEDCRAKKQQLLEFISTTTRTTR